MARHHRTLALACLTSCAIGIHNGHSKPSETLSSSFSLCATNSTNPLMLPDDSSRSPERPAHAKLLLATDPISAQQIECWASVAFPFTASRRLPAHCARLLTRTNLAGSMGVREVLQLPIEVSYRSNPAGLYPTNCVSRSRPASPAADPACRGCPNTGSAHGARLSPPGPRPRCGPSRCPTLHGPCGRCRQPTQP